MVYLMLIALMIIYFIDVEGRLKCGGIILVDVDIIIGVDDDCIMVAIGWGSSVLPTTTGLNPRFDLSFTVEENYRVKRR